MAGLNLVFENKASRTKSLVETLIKYVIAEDKIKSPDSLQKAKTINDVRISPPLPVKTAAENRHCRKPVLLD